jgi:uncharacterized repeat protein (TIGR01451 family)
MVGWKHRLAQAAATVGKSRLARFAAALVLSCATTTSAIATIDNTVTVTGTGPFGQPVTAQATEQVDVADANPLIAINKTHTFAPGGDLNNNGLVDVGDTVLFSYSVTNSGNVTLADVNVSDTAFQGTGTQSAILVPTTFTDGGPAGGSSDPLTGDGDWDQLGPGDTIVFTRTYTVPVGDFTIAGNTDNDLDTIGQATGSYGAQTPAATDPEDVPLNTAVGGITLVKTGTPNFGVVAPAGVANPGDTVSYTFTAQNTGVVALNNVTITDPGLTVAGGAIGTLAPSASATANATLTLSQAMIDAGVYSNTAAVTGDPANGAPQVSANDTENVLLTAPPAITLVKTGTLNDGGDGIANVGDTVSYSFTAQNTGYVTLNAVTITDPGLTVVGGNIGTLAPGASGSATATLTLTQAMINAGVYNNTATVNATPANGVPLAPVSDNETVPLPAPAIALVKNGTVNVGANGRPDANETISYSFTVTNTGNQPLTNVTVSDPLVTVSGAPIPLLPGQSNSTNFTASYTLTQTDIDAGTFANTATVSGQPPVGLPVSAPGVANTALVRQPALTFVKTGVADFNATAPAGLPNVGDVTTYTLDVTNTGNVTLSNVTVTDPGVTVSGGAIGSLAPGATAQATASYTITQANINAGTFSNTANVTGNPPTGPPLSVNDTENVTIPNTPRITLAKIGSLDLGTNGVANPGDVITYAFRVENTGVTTLTNVALTDLLPGVIVSGGPIATMLPGDVDNTTFSATYAITQADINAGTVTNNARVTAQSGATQVQASASTPVPVPSTSSIAIVKVPTPNFGPNAPQADAGDTIQYTFTVTNTGQTTLTNIRVTDPMIPSVSLQGLDEQVIAVFEATKMMADPLTTGTVNPAVTQQKPATIAPTRSLPEVQAGLSVSRSAAIIQGDPAALIPGDRIGFVFSITNTGMVPLINIRVDQATGEAFENTLEYLAPIETNASTVIYVHELTLEDLNNGYVDAPAQIEATVRDRLLKQSVPVRVMLSDLKPYEEFATASITPTSIPTLAPGASAVFNATYVITQANINAGQAQNQAQALGKPPTGPDVSDFSDESDPAGNDPTIVPLPPVPGIALVKTSSLNLGSDNLATAGDILTYTYAVTNTGNLTITTATVTDTSFPGINIASPTVTNLAPGATRNVTGTYAITQADIDAGLITNQADVNGTAANGAPVTDTSDDDSTAQDEPTETPIPQTPSIAVVKVAAAPTTNLGIDAARTDAGDTATPGDTITYTFTVRNTGNVTLTNVTLSDPLLGGALPGSIASLLPGVSDTTTFTATYALTQADVDLGRVQNQATATGTPPTGPNVTDLSDEQGTLPTDNDPTIRTVPRAASVAVLKEETPYTDVNGNGFLDLGDIINYRITVTNTGTVTITSATLSDPVANSLSGTTLSNLAPGASSIFTATHTVVANDVTAREVQNQAFVSGTTPAGNVNDRSDFDPAVYQLPTNNRPTVTPVTELRIGLVKVAQDIEDVNLNNAIDENDVITYQFSVVNLGTEPLQNIVVTDPLTGLSVITYDSGDQNSDSELDADNPSTPANEAETWVFEATYVITAADITAGNVTNQANVTSQTTSGFNVSDDSDNNSPTENDPTVTPVGTPGVALIKTVSSIDDTNGNGVNDAGDVINYAFTVTNTGALQLTNVQVTDPDAAVQGGPLATLAVGAVDNTTFTASYTITTADVDAGRVTNQAEVTAGSIRGDVDDLSDDTSITENDPTVTPLVAAPGIAIIKTITSVTDVNRNGVNDVGDVINYAFAITNTGNVTLTNVTVTDNNADVTGTPIASLAPGSTNSSAFTATHRITGEDATEGEVRNQAIATGTSPAGDVISDLSDNDSLGENEFTVIEVVPAAPEITKAASKSEIRRGEAVTYTITATGIASLRTAIRDILPPSFIYDEGSATANGQPITPRASGRVLTFTGYAPDIDGKVVIRLRMFAGATITSGRFVNKVELVNGDNGVIVARAEAAVEVKPEHVFDCGEVIGRVFHDINGNGYADEGEPGIPGAKVVTVNGLIITSDKHGRFHVACADLPRADIGSNFILKLDVASLPQGFVLTTENPRDVRLTRGKVTKLNFGVQKSCDVRLDIRRDAFQTNSTKLKPKWSQGITDLADVLQNCPGKLTIVYSCGQYAPIADERLRVVEDAVLAKWSEGGAPYDLDINSRLECGK